MDSLFGDIPVIGFFVGALLLALASAEVGYRWAENRQARRGASSGWRYGRRYAGLARVSSRDHLRNRPRRLSGEKGCSPGGNQCDPHELLADWHYTRRASCR